MQITGFKTDAVAVFVATASAQQISDIAEAVASDAAERRVLQTSVNYDDGLLYLDWVSSPRESEIETVEASLLESGLVEDIVEC